MKGNTTGAASTSFNHKQDGKNGCQLLSNFTVMASGMYDHASSLEP